MARQVQLLIAAVSAAEGPSGVCRHACNLIRCALMSDDIRSINVFIGRWQKNYFVRWEVFQNKKVNLIDIDIQNKSISRNLWYLLTLPSVAKKYGVNVVHVIFPVPIIRRLFKSAVVVSLHDFYPYDQPNNFHFPAVWFNRAFLRGCLKESDFACCVSEETIVGLNRWIPRSGHRKSMVIHNCIDIGKLVAPKIGSLSDRVWPFFLVVAQHRENKNIPLALDVFSELLRRRAIESETELIIVGNSGPETVRLEAHVEQLDLKKRVRFVTGLSDEELFHLYSSCEALLVPSLVEGFCLPLIEALCCGGRVVCSDIPVLREIGGDACHYFDLHGGSPLEAMIAAIRIALREERREAAGVERFSIENTAPKYMSVYRRLIDRVQ